VILHRASLAEDEVEQRQGYRVTTPVRAIVESASAQVDQEMVDSAVTEAFGRGLTTQRLLLAAASPLSSLGVVRLLIGDLLVAGTACAVALALHREQGKRAPRAGLGQRCVAVRE
jgi:hypothetical protein